MTKREIFKVEDDFDRMVSDCTRIAAMIRFGEALEGGSPAAEALEMNDYEFSRNVSER